LSTLDFGLAFVLVDQGGMFAVAARPKIGQFLKKSMTSSSPAQDENLGWLRDLWERGWLKGCLLVVAVVFAYQPVWHAGFIWDDDVYVTNNPLLTAPDGLKRIWFSLDSPSQYFPLTYTTFRLERALWGLKPAGYHWVNLLLHVANALLVWRLLKRLGVPGAWLAAAIFALHPVQVESVAWITERKNILSLLFFLLSLLAWIEFVEERPKQWWRFYFLSLFFFALALFSKTTACTLPAALLLVLWLKGKPINWSRLTQIAPFLVLGVGMGLVTVWWERYHQGTQGALFSYGLPERILIASHAIWFYAGKLVWPVNLTFSYPHWTINPADPFAYGWLVAGAGLGAAIYFARRFTGRGVEVAALFYVATLSPMLGFIMLYTFWFSFVADHYQYIASIGPIALAAGGITTAPGILGKGKRFLKPAFCGVLLLTLAVLTWRQGGMYADLDTLWRTTLARNPGCSMAHDNLGILLRRKGQLDEAIAHFQKALEIQPDNARVHNNLGNALLQNGQLDEAIAHFQKALEIQPNLAVVHDNLGAVFLKKGQIDEAIAQFRRALDIQPGLVEAHYNLGLALFQKGQLDSAIAHFAKVLEIQPDLADAHANLGTVFLQKGQVAEAMVHFQKVLELQPQNIQVLNNLAWMLATSPDASVRNGTRAIGLAQQAEQLSGGKDPAIITILAAAYAEAGRFPEAVTTAQQALQLASIQTNTAVLNALQTQIKCYQAGSPFRDTSLTNTLPFQSQPRH
jgi:tetratricopeptide (TPR) repeat protein